MARLLPAVVRCVGVPVKLRLRRMCFLIVLVPGLVFIAYFASPAEADPGYAVIREFSVGSYRGVESYLDTANPNLQGGSFSNATIWALDAGCGANEWIEVGWSKRAEWGANAKYKLIFQVEPSCSYYKYSLGTPAAGSTHVYRLVWCGTNCPALWYYYIDGQFKASVATTWTRADELNAGGEVSSAGSTQMGPSYFSSLSYQTDSGSWVSFNYDDDSTCTAPYNGVYPGYQPYAIYDWGPAAPYPCFFHP